MKNVWSRREMISAGVCASAAFAAGIFASKSARAASEPVAQTVTGKVRGITQDGVHIFKGIPYGASTAGRDRFMPPQPVVPWKGERAALEYGPSTPQSDSTVQKPAGIAEPPENEECLVLNVWTRGLRDGVKRPVMFWLHGGGFVSGSGSSPGTDGTNLTKRGDVVVVSINHRLNVLGFGYLAGLGGAEFAQTGNVGLLDIVQALQWVRDNIENFGGDPNRVMIFGESGGGRKVGTLLAMPAAKGLFHRAAMQSGATIKVVSQDDATAAILSVMDELQISRADFRKLQEVPTQKLIQAYFAASKKHNFLHTTNGFAPVVEGSVLPQHPFHPQASSMSADIPLLIGTNRTEMTLFLASDTAVFSLDEAGLKSRAQELLGKNAGKVTAAYRAAEPSLSPSELFLLMSSDQRYCVPVITIADRRSALKKAPVYAYYLTWRTPVQGGKLMTPHALDVPFVFDNTEQSSGFTGGGPRAAALADKMSDAWIAFARAGDPNVSKLPQWKPYTTDQRAMMVFDDTSAMVNDPLGQRRVAMAEALEL